MTVTSWLTRGLSALLALALLLGSLLAIAEIAAAAADRGPWLVPYPDWTAWLREHSWDDSIVITVLVGLVVVGLLLLFLAVRRGKPTTLPLRARTTGVDVKASRKSVERSLAAAASRTTGVTGAEATIRRRSARVRARTATGPQPGLREEVDSAVTARLNSLGLARSLRPRINVYAKDQR